MEISIFNVGIEEGDKAEESENINRYQKLRHENVAYLVSISNTESFVSGPSNNYNLNYLKMWKPNC